MSCTVFFLFNDTATTEIYTLSLHDALPISARSDLQVLLERGDLDGTVTAISIEIGGLVDRKSTRLNSSHLGISYAVFCLKKKRIQPCLICVVYTVSVLPSHFPVEKPMKVCG